MGDKFLMGCTLLIAFVHLCVLSFWHTCAFSGYINRLCRHHTVFLESMSDNLLCSVRAQGL